jgi:hypothetical protein
MDDSPVELESVKLPDFPSFMNTYIKVVGVAKKT